MQVIRLAAPGRDAVNIQPAQRRSGIGKQRDAGFLDDLAAGRVADGSIFRLDVAARQQPAIQPSGDTQNRPVGDTSKPAS